MKIIVKGKNYECTKIVGRKYDKFCDVMHDIDTRQSESNTGFNKDDMALMRELIVDLFDNKFTSDDLYDDLDVSELVFKFLEVQAEVESKLNNKIEKIQKNSASKKK
ncbi:hypothetical protein [uncultured Clostridium sp.]|jgi:hypothetical protein|uniref:phage tail assembly chaperone G n=1 Tax=uncultured Clostridium sp. TaxID=59620 RepID=UPI00262AC974|nr:hypothetical protein [uncultured Clostridium sp.]